MSTEPFRFLDFPAKLRLMVYEAIPITTRRQTFEHVEGGQTLSMTLTKRCFLVSLLATSKFIHQEAKQIIGKKLRQLELEPVRVKTDLETLVAITADFSAQTRYKEQIIDITNFCRRFLARTSTVTRSAAHPHRVEVAVEPSVRSFSARDMFQTWYTSSAVAHKISLSCTILYRDTLPTVAVGQNTVPGLSVWSLVQNEVSMELSVQPEDMDRNLTVQELDEKDWVQMQEGWYAL
jgi:hypothetical protein